MTRRRHTLQGLAVTLVEAVVLAAFFYAATMVVIVLTTALTV